MTNKLLWLGITCMIAAALVSIIAHVSAQQPFVIMNQTKPANDTNGLLKQIIGNQKLQIQLQQLNANVIATKLDTVRVELQKLEQNNVIIPATIISPGCGIGTDNSLCNVPVPPFNATTCKQQNDAGVLIYCPTPTFPFTGNTPEQQLPAPPIPPPFLAWLPPDLGMGAVTDCIYTVYGVFCPTN